MESSEQASGTTIMSALLKTGLVVLDRTIVLTPRGKDMYPGTWTRGHHPSVLKHIIIRKFCNIFVF